MKNKNLIFLLKKSKAPKNFYIITLTLLLYTSIINLNVSILLQKAIAYALGEEDNLNFSYIFLAFVIIIVFYGLFRYLHGVYNEKIKQHIGENLKRNVLQKVFNCKYKYIQNYNNGDILNMLNKDSEISSEFVVKNIFPLISMILPIAFGLVYIFRKSYIMGLVVVSFLPFLYLISKKLSKNIEKFQALELEESGKQKTFFEEYYNNIESIKVFGMFKALSKRNNMLFKKVFDHKLNKVKDSSKMYSIIDGSIFGVELLVVVIGVVLYYYGKINISDMIAVSNVAIGSVVWPITVVPTILDNLKRSYASVNRLQGLFDIEEETYNTDIENITDDVILVGEEINFSYDDSKNYILNNYNIEVHKKDIIFLVGESGCGKSSLLKTLVQLYDIQDGEIYIKSGNKKLCNLRKYITYVPQEENVFNLSIKENLTLGNDVPFDEIVNVMKEVNLHENILSLENQYDTIITSENRLSIGQEKRLSIARALLRNTPFILMDEPFSSLDNENSKKIAKIIQKLSKDKGFLIVSHNSNLNKYATKIINM